jgi:hypothetical protein
VESSMPSRIISPSMRVTVHRGVQSIVVPTSDMAMVHYVYNTISGEMDDFKIVLSGKR